MIDSLNPSGQGLAGMFGAAGASDAAEAAPSLTLDADAYLPMLAEFDLSDDQARELLSVLWGIMRGFVELGITHDVCGQLGLDAVPVLPNPSAPLDSDDQPT